MQKLIIAELKLLSQYPGNVTLTPDGMKLHVKELEDDDLFRLYRVTKIAKKVTLKRSGTGITVIIKTK